MPCQQVTISEPDASSLTTGNLSVSTTGSNSAEASIQAVNSIDSGSGQTLNPTFEFKVDGSVEATDTVSIAPGATEVVRFNVSGLSTGDHELCIDPQ